MTALDNYQLSDRYTSDEGRVYLTGVQALARVPIEQLRADKAAGLNTAAFVSGYQGSPLGGYDRELAAAIKTVSDLKIVSRPALNEELAATAVMGSQIALNQPDAIYDGVLGLWYGKAPGLDRASDALRHAVFAGASSTGGAVALVGDDPASKSSTLPSGSDASLVALRMPLFYPGNVQEVMQLTRHAIALSRYAGMWTSVKVVTPVADGSGSVELGSLGFEVALPDRAEPPKPNGHLITPHSNRMEQDLVTRRLTLAQRYGVINNLNRITVNPTNAWIGIVAAGYTYWEALQALAHLGLNSAEKIEAAGIRLMQLQMPYPLDRAVMRGFAQGLDEVLVVEEKGPVHEWSILSMIYGGASQPTVVGQRDENGDELIPGYGFLHADVLLEPLRRRLSPRVATMLDTPAGTSAKKLIPLNVKRTPYFCSGCPHNWGTKAPAESLVGAGIGCSGMALYMDQEKVGDKAGITAMGNEGSQWIGMEPFIQRDHFIQNIGDGTFFHSGQLAVQAAVAAGSNITFKLLYNDAVAMTGGQQPQGGVEVPEIAQLLVAYGVSEVLITNDGANQYGGRLPKLSSGAEIKVWDRTRIVEAQRHLATIEGVTVLIHDQVCAAQARRLRKRSQLTTPPLKVFVNHRICEACGDCGEVSNCLSVQSVDTALGPKTVIDQSSCNRDYSCLEGDCPSFMTINYGKKGEPKVEPSNPAGSDLDLPMPEMVPRTSFNMRLAGIGGTGVVTVAQILATAAMLDGWRVRGLDQTGLSQKAGPVLSDIKLDRDEPATSNLLGEGEADLILGLDLLVAAGDNAMKAAASDRTVLVASSSKTPTGEMIGRSDVTYPSGDLMSERVAELTFAEKNIFVDAANMTRQIFGSSAAANLFMVGVAFQAGLLPVDPLKIERAIDLNGVATEVNRQAFRWGRRWVLNPSEVAAGWSTQAASHEVFVTPLAEPLLAVINDWHLPDDLKDLVVLLTADLVLYQNKKYATRYLRVLDGAVQAERSLGAGGWRFVEVVARGLHKIMAYKDEYEVARLLVGSEGLRLRQEVWGSGAKAAWRLHPPILRSLGMNKKLSVPVRVGWPFMKFLAAAKWLRGTPFDPFGRAEVRKVERALVSEYIAAIESLSSKLAVDSYEPAIELAMAAMDVRGYEQLKLERAVVLRSKLARLV